jgi:hypothetical protein
MRTITSVLVAVAVLFLPTVCAWATPDDTFHIDNYAAVLQAVVGEDGTVDYAALAAHPERLREFLASIDLLTADTYEAWDEDARVAFWINAYNALTLALIVEHYPIVGKAGEYPSSSIRQIAGAWDTISFPVMGEQMTLDHIENAILRGEFGEPRIHMALVCAARSCPPLRREPYAGPDLDAQLDAQTRRFLASPHGFAVDRDAGVVRLSAIFDWFAHDFVEEYGRAPGRFDTPRQAVMNFVGRYVSDAHRAYLETDAYRVEYLEYDWTLNERAQ